MRLHFGDADVPDAGLEGADIVILPLCYEAAPSYGAGAGKGPYHILDASVQLENIDEETLVDWSALNIHTHPAIVPDADPERAVGQMKQAAEKIFRGKKFLRFMARPDLLIFWVKNILFCLCIIPQPL